MAPRTLYVLQPAPQEGHQLDIDLPKTGALLETDVFGDEDAPAASVPDLKPAPKKHKLKSNLSGTSDPIDTDTYHDDDWPTSPVPLPDIGDSIKTKDADSKKKKNELKMFSWQETELIETDEPIIPEDVNEDLALFCQPDSPPPEVTSVEVAAVVPEVNCRCKDCGVVIDRFPYWCVQCLRGALCGACAAHSAHEAHYVLRAPLQATPNHTQAVLACIRRHLQKENLLTLYELGEDGVKVELIEEPEERPLTPLSPAPPDPLHVELHPEAEEFHLEAEEPRSEAEEPPPEAEEFHLEAMELHPEAEEPYPEAEEFYLEEEESDSEEFHLEAEEPQSEAKEPQPEAEEPYPEAEEFYLEEEESQSEAEEFHLEAEEPQSEVEELQPEAEEPYPEAEEFHLEEEESQSEAEEPQSEADKSQRDATDNEAINVETLDHHPFKRPRLSYDNRRPVKPNLIITKGAQKQPTVNILKSSKTLQAHGPNNPITKVVIHPSDLKKTVLNMPSDHTNAQPFLQVVKATPTDHTKLQSCTKVLSSNSTQSQSRTVIKASDITEILPGIKFIPSDLLKAKAHELKPSGLIGSCTQKVQPSDLSSNLKLRLQKEVSSKTPPTLKEFQKKQKGSPLVSFQHNLKDTRQLIKVPPNILKSFSLNRIDKAVANTERLVVEDLGKDIDRKNRDKEDAHSSSDRERQVKGENTSKDNVVRSKNLKLGLQKVVSSKAPLSLKEVQKIHQGSPLISAQHNLKGTQPIKVPQNILKSFALNIIDKDSVTNTEIHTHTYTVEDIAKDIDRKNRDKEDAPSSSDRESQVKGENTSKDNVVRSKNLKLGLQKVVSWKAPLSLKEVQKIHRGSPLISLQHNLKGTQPIKVPQNILKSFALNRIDKDSVTNTDRLVVEDIDRKNRDKEDAHSSSDRERQVKGENTSKDNVVRSKNLKLGLQKVVSSKAPLSLKEVQKIHQGSPLISVQHNLKGTQPIKVPQNILKSFALNIIDKDSVTNTEIHTHTYTVEDIAKDIDRKNRDKEDAPSSSDRESQVKGENTSKDNVVRSKNLKLGLQKVVSWKAPLSLKEVQKIHRGSPLISLQHNLKGTKPIKVPQNILKSFALNRIDKDSVTNTDRLVVEDIDRKNRDKEDAHSSSDRERQVKGENTSKDNVVRSKNLKLELQKVVSSKTPLSLKEVQKIHQGSRLVSLQNNIKGTQLIKVPQSILIARIDNDSVTNTEGLVVGDLGKDIDRKNRDKEDRYSPSDRESKVEDEKTNKDTYRIDDSVKDVESEVDDSDLDKDYAVEDDRIDEDSDTDLEDIAGRGVCRITRNATNTQAGSSKIVVPTLTLQDVVVEMQPLTPAEIRKWTDRKRPREN